ncbi:hypothetical protein CBS101457_006693 [Exobasidium rhododendri]|nr:hypothetical protein CBS101457_006693 [Exobasidium rhododendri]
MRLQVGVSVSLLIGFFAAIAQAQAPAGAIEKCTNGHIALTFDDGPTLQTRKVIDLLAKYGQHATFFVNVNNYDCNYKQEYVDTLRYALQMNMTLASHTAGHPHMPQLNDEQVRFQIRETNRYLKRVVNLVPKFIRLPYGETDARIERIIKEEFHMEPIYWSIDTADSLGATEAEEIAVFDPLGKGSQDIIIMHDTKAQFADVTFEKILKVLQQKGLKSSGMARCLGMPRRRDAYSFYEPKYKPRTDKWTCDNIPIGNP